MPQNDNGMIIAVAFDGTLAEHRYPDIGPEIDGAFYWLQQWQALGARLILYTMRSHGSLYKEGRDTLNEAVEWCRMRGVEFWAVNVCLGQADWSDSSKVYAHLYVDDAAFGCPLVRARHGSRERSYANWEEIGEAVQDRIVIWNREHDFAPNKEIENVKTE